MAARKQAVLLTSISRDDEWRALTRDQQWTYTMLLSRSEVNPAGVLPYNPRKWARLASDVKLDDLYTDLEALVAARFVVIDEESDELLVRSFIRNDGVIKLPNMMLGAVSHALNVESPAIRLTLAAELRRVLVLLPSSSLRAKIVTKIKEALPLLDPENPSPIPTGIPSPDPSPIPSGIPQEGAATTPNGAREVSPEYGMPDGMPDRFRDPHGVGAGVGTGAGASSVGGHLGGSRARTRGESPPPPIPLHRNATTGTAAPCGTHPDDDRPCHRCRDVRLAAPPPPPAERPFWS